MRCPQCSYISFDQQDHCLKCSSDLSAIAEELKGTGLNVEPPFFLGGVLGEPEVATETAEASFEDEAVDLGDLDIDSLSADAEMGADLGDETDFGLATSSLAVDEDEADLPSLGLEDIDVADLMPSVDDEVPGLDLDLDLDDDVEAEGGIALESESEPESEPEPETESEVELSLEPEADLSLDEEVVTEVGEEIEFSLDAEPELELPLESAVDIGSKELAEEKSDEPQGDIEMDLPELDTALPPTDEIIDFDLSVDLDEPISDSVDSDDDSGRGDDSGSDDIVDLSSLMDLGASDEDAGDDLDLGLNLEGDNDLTSNADNDAEHAADIPDLNLTLEGDDDE